MIFATMISTQSDHAQMSPSQPLQGTMNQHLRPEPVPFHRPWPRSVAGSASSVDEAGCPGARPLPVHSMVPESRAARGGGLRRTAAPSHVVTCASGTDALLMVLMAKGRRPWRCGCSVRRLRFARPAKAGGALIGATPVFVDVDAATFQHGLEFA